MDNTERARVWLAESWPLELPAPLVSKVTSLLDQVEAEGAKKERAAVVRWLHRHYNGVAYALQIERGDHLKGEGA